MAEENEIIQPAAPVEKTNRAEERITELSDKVKSEAEGRVKAETEKNEAEKRATFAEGFADVIGAHPQAKDHKDEIKAKVMAGYTVQDATFAVLGAAGKLANNQPKTQVAGGSAATTPQSGQKELKDMTAAEKRAELEKVIVWQ